MKSKKLKPVDLAKEGLKLLKIKANPQRAEQVQRYFKEKITALGLTAKEARDLARELYQTVKNDWSVDEAIELCEILLPNPYHEAKGLATLVLTEYRRHLPKALFFRVNAWLSNNYLNNWAAVDTLCPEVMGALLEQYPELIEKIKEWMYSPNRWVKRASAISFIKLARNKKYLDSIYQIATSLFHSDDDLIQKANGWLLREAGKTDSERLEKFLLEQRVAIPRTTLRYAIERFDENKRKDLLLKTRRDIP